MNKDHDFDGLFDPPPSSRGPRRNPRLGARAVQVPVMLTLTEAAAVVGVRVDVIYAAIRGGALVAYRVGCRPRLVRSIDLLRWARAARTASA